MVDTHDHEFKVILIGDTGVGKSSMLLRYTDDTFESTYNATADVESKRITVDISSKVVQLQFRDTGGQERFRASFHNVRHWAEVMQEHAEEGVQTLLVGNKADCTERRQVYYSEAEQLADKLGADYFETSAKIAMNIHAAFYSLVSKMLSSKENEQHNNPAPQIMTSPYQDNEQLISLVETPNNKMSGLKACILL